ncbi:MAG TPA: peptidoglycan DD-metalloendopeptidase family protein [Longimicrobium sp.]|nr:peptidoglycan DD-metalloendopeptidase family protein [Longimicrobium sp.]
MANPYRLLSGGLLGAFGLALGTAFLRDSTPEPPAPPKLLPEAHAAPVEHVRREKLRYGHTLAELLQQLRVDGQQAHAILAQLPDSAAGHEVREGREYDLRIAARTGGVRRLTLQLDADRVLTVDGRGGSLRARVDSVEVHTDTAVFSGSVRTSLYQALGEGHGDIPRRERRLIADQIADEIFETRIDFSNDLNPGDSYQILYERTVRPDNSARRSRLLAVRFLLSGHLYDAYLFRRDGKDGWYDGKGQALKRGFLRAPLEFRRISSGFTLSRFHPILHRWRAHVGIDFAASPGTPVRAVADGVVRTAGYSGGYGNVVEIAHGRGYSTRYGHLRGFAKGVRAGSRVSQGQVIAYVGSTGLATGPHLHYEFRSNGRPINPQSVKEIQAEPVDGSRFRAVVEARVAAMERVGGVKLAERTERNGRSGRRRAD